MNQNTIQYWELMKRGLVKPKDAMENRLFTCNDLAYINKMKNDRTLYRT